MEHEWMETKVKSLRDYIDANPFETLEDRTEVVMSAKGTPVIKIIQTKEQQVKLMMDILKELPSLFQALEELRAQKEASSIEIRGGGDMSGMMKNHLNNQHD